MNDNLLSLRSFLSRAAALNRAAQFADSSDWAPREDDETYVGPSGWSCWTRERVNGRGAWRGYGSGEV